MIEELINLQKSVTVLIFNLKTLTEKVERLEKKELPTGEEYIPWKNGRIIRYKKDHKNVRIFFTRAYDIGDGSRVPAPFWLDTARFLAIPYSGTEFNTRYWEIVDEYTIVGIDKV